VKRTIQVHLGDPAQSVGTLHFDAVGQRQRAAFAYQAGWLEREERFALEPALPLVAGPQFHGVTPQGSVFHGCIADTEPDGWAKRVILRDHAKRRQEARRQGHEPGSASLTAVDFLLAVDDFSRVGALRFRDEEGLFCRGPQKGRRTAPPLIELDDLLRASRAVEEENETSADLAYLQGRGTSLGGMRPKCTVVDEDGHLAIGKFPSITDTRAVTKGEVLALKLAKSAGINAAEARVAESAGLPVALVRRFDRVSGGRRLMYVSAATLLGGDDGQEHFYTEIVDAIRQHGADTAADIEELWRRMAFSILITNVDDHLHNHGFLHTGRGQWRLAPAFDLNPFPERQRDLKTWISEDSGPEASIDALMGVAPYFRISLKRAKGLLHEVEHSVAGWQAQGKALGMTSRELETFEDAFEHSEREVARQTSRQTF
jgi:serine/threonine-protein kinase HipA